MPTRWTAHHVALQLDPNIFVRLAAEPHVQGKPTPRLIVGAEVWFGSECAIVTWTDGAEAVLQFPNGRSVRIGPLPPSRHGVGVPSFEPGAGHADWQVIGDDEDAAG